MNILENISLATSSLRSNKMRSFLTMLGIIIGIASVIAIFTVGDSLSNFISTSMQELGANNITVSVSQKEMNVTSTLSDLYSTSGSVDIASLMTQFSGSQIDSNDLISDEMLIDMKEEFKEEIQAYSVSETVGNGTTSEGRNYANFSLIGVNSEYNIVNALSLVEGRFINEKDVEGYKRVVVVSEQLAKNMFNTTEVIGNQITLSTSTHVSMYTIVGVYEGGVSEMSLMMGTSEKDVRTDVFIPISTAQNILYTDGYQQVTVLANTSVNSTELASRIAVFFERYYSRNNDYGIRTMSMESMMNSVTSIISTVNTAIAAVAAISLLVGGIGVMNIMMVSITERTREIGTRKALGATNAEIRTQFITEAIIICIIGGAIGIALGMAMGSFGANLIGAPATTSLQAILIATGFSVAIGLFFGYYPANKAAKLDPIDALRYE